MLRLFLTLGLVAASASRFVGTGLDQPTPSPDETPTVIVDPPPTPAPVHLPAAQNRFDARAPGPVLAQAEGFVTRLEPSGRSACAPATHALLEREDDADSVVAVVYAALPDDPRLELDLYLGERVEITGPETMAATACVITHRLIAVERLRLIQLPPR